MKIGSKEYEWNKLSFISDLIVLNVKLSEIFTF